MSIFAFSSAFLDHELSTKRESRIPTVESIHHFSFAPRST
jgi:hypothetical protein